MPENSEHAAVVVKMIVVENVGLAGHSVSIAFCRDSLQGFWNDSTEPCITGAPFSWMRNSLRATVPMFCTDTLYCAAICLTWASEAAGTATTTRDPLSPKSVASAGSSAAAELI